MQAKAVFSLLDLGVKDFQLEFLHDLDDLVTHWAELSLNNYLDQLNTNPRNANYTNELIAARATPKLQLKVTLIKQLLDRQVHLDGDLGQTYVLHNLVFLNRLRSTLGAAKETSNHELRLMRMQRLCQQLDRQAPQLSSKLINERTVGAALQHLNLTNSSTFTGLELNEFGAQLYERVKLSGAEIIDSYLRILRSILQDIIDGDHAEQAVSNGKLDSMLKQLDAMLNTQDLYEKRQKVYAYLELHLTTDFENMRDSARSERLTEHLLAQLKNKGLDLIVIFLFSNFEFLDLVHEHWQLLLPQTPSLLYEETARQLFDLQQSYETFRRDTESEYKYGAYLDALRRLHERTVDQGQRNRHIFELLHNAAQSVGTVTFNMIRAKCKELT